LGLKSDHDNHPGNTGSALIFCIGVCNRIDLSVHAVLIRSSGRPRINLTSTTRPIGTGVRRGVEGAVRRESGQPTMSSLAGGAESD
jgi:hypothetical protein